MFNSLIVALALCGGCQPKVVEVAPPPRLSTDWFENGMLGEAPNSTVRFTYLVAYLDSNGNIQQNITHFTLFSPTPESAKKVRDRMEVLKKNPIRIIAKVKGFSVINHLDGKNYLVVEDIE